VKLELVAVTNWMSHESSELVLNGDRFLTIRGDHGVGKTALVEAIPYALSGRGRFDTADEPVRIGTTDMSVRVEWHGGDGLYRVIRRRTTKAGGKGSLSFALQAPDGSWTSLDGESIKSTEARIRDVVGVDGETFEAIAFLMQGRITALVDATSGGRRDVLVAGLLLEVWPRAAARARKEAGEVDARIKAARISIETLEARLAEKPELEALRSEADGHLVANDAEISAERDALEQARARLGELEVQLAGVDALAGRIAVLEGDKTAAADDWRRATARLRQAHDAIDVAKMVLARADEIDAAAAALARAKAELEALVAAEAADRALAQELERRRAETRGIEQAYSEAVSTHRANYESARRRVDELAAAAQALEPVVCEKCHHPNVVDQAGILPALAAARAEFKALERAGAPKAPPGLLTEKAAVEGIERRRREAGFDPARLPVVHAEVNRLTSIAAGAEGLEAARTSVAREETAAAEAETERTAAATKGQAIAEQIEGLRAELEAAERIREERSEIADRVRIHAAALEQLEGSRRSLERTVATIDAQLAELGRIAGEAATQRAAIKADDVELTRLRKLVAAYGDLPLRIIDASLPELQAEAQALLDELDPGASLEISAQRATVDGKKVVSAIDILYTDGVGRRDVRMCSGGERVAASVALSLGLRRVLARHHGARLETVAIDEPDGLDSTQRRALATAMRTLAHRGDLARVVLITHSEDLAESGDGQVVVSKNGAGSRLERVA
jgi:exonuclease SbcC